MPTIKDQIVFDQRGNNTQGSVFETHATPQLGECKRTIGHVLALVIARSIIALAILLATMMVGEAGTGKKSDASVKMSFESGATGDE